MRDNLPPSLRGTAQTPSLRGAAPTPSLRGAAGDKTTHDVCYAPQPRLCEEPQATKQPMACATRPNPVFARSRRRRSNPWRVLRAPTPSLRGAEGDEATHDVCYAPQPRLCEEPQATKQPMTCATRPNPVFARNRRRRSNPWEALRIDCVRVICDEPFGVTSPLLTFKALIRTWVVTAFSRFLIPILQYSIEQLHCFI